MYSKEKLYKQAISKWGLNSQLTIAIEECSELIQAISKFWRDGEVDNLREEIADVSIMIEQLALYFGKDEVDEIKDWKLKRLQERLEDV